MHFASTILTGISYHWLILLRKWAVTSTYRNHTGGTDKVFKHPPCHKNHILPSNRGNQILNDVVRPRTIQPIKDPNYSTTFQISDQCGLFQEIDTISITNYWINKYIPHKLIISQVYDFICINLEDNLDIVQIQKKLCVVKICHIGEIGKF